MKRWLSCPMCGGAAAPFGDTMRCVSTRCAYSWPVSEEVTTGLL